MAPKNLSAHREHTLPALPSSLTAMLRTVRQPLMVLNADLRVLYTNRFFVQAFPTAFAPNNGCCPWDFPALRLILQTALPKCGAVEDLEVTLPFPTLGDRRLLLNASCLPGAKPENNLVLVSFEDVTDTLPREILTIWESMTDAFYAVDLDWRFTYINAQGEALLQKSRQELIGKNLWEAFPQAVDLAFYSRYRQAMEEQVPVRFEEFFEPLQLWSEVHAYPSPVGLSVYFRDITERHRSDAVVQKSVDMLQAITEGTTDAVFVKNREGFYLMINRAGARIMGAEPDEIIGSDDSLFFDEDMTGSISANDQRTMENGVAHTYEEVGTSGGVRRTFLATKAPYRDSLGNVIGVIGISRDITELKRLQGQLAQSERLAAMGELVAGVAHELNNPLAAISGNAQLLLHHSDALVRADAQTIKAMTDRAARIVRSLVTFSRHVDNADRRPLSLHHVIDETLEMVRYKLRKSNVEVVRDLAPSDLLPPVISGKIEQVLLNLFGNAEYALRERAENREIRITTRSIQHCGREWATIAVSDNGTGIPPEDQRRIFNPFFTTKPLGEGTGLGLSICHGILEEHDGKLTVDSDGETGATFTLWLPMIAPSPADP